MYATDNPDFGAVLWERLVLEDSRLAIVAIVGSVADVGGEKGSEYPRRPMLSLVVFLASKERLLLERWYCSLKSMTSLALSHA